MTNGPPAPQAHTASPSSSGRSNPASTTTTPSPRPSRGLLVFDNDAIRPNQLPVLPSSNRRPCLNDLRVGSVCHHGTQCCWEHVTYASPVDDLRSLQTFVDSHENITWANGTPNRLRTTMPCTSASPGNTTPAPTSTSANATSAPAQAHPQG